MEEQKVNRKSIGGRKPLSENKKKSVQKKVYFTPLQYEAIESKRKKTRYKDFSSYVSFLVTSRSESLNLTSSFDTKVLQELRKINSLINQIARTINANKENLDEVKTFQQIGLVYEYFRSLEAELRTKL